MQPRFPSTTVRHDAGTRALAGLLVLEVALFLGAVAWQKAVDASGLMAVKPALLTLAGLLLAAVAVALIVRAILTGREGRRALALALLANLAALAIALAASEAVLRLLARPTSEGIAIGPAILPPTWDEMRARNAAVLAGGRTLRTGWLTYVVPDDELGWTVGPDRHTPDGLYFSSAEGIRSGAPGVRYAGTQPKLRIALVGDSYTFSMDGPWEDSWGYQLERLLGEGVQVLNFGVDGYGIDQAYLRYERDVRRWQPDVVLFGLIQHDVQRTVAVYPFIDFGWDYPFAKPRFALEGEGLELINVPLIDADRIVTIDDPAALPFAAFDRGYAAGDWRWRSGRPPLLARLFGAAFPRWSGHDPFVADQAAIDIGGRLLRRFAAGAAADGIDARIIYFPSEGAGDFGRRVRTSDRLARRMLADYALEHLDLTDCVRAVPAGRRLIAGNTHYSGASNGAVARCVAEDLLRRGVRTGGTGAG